ncbi:MAG TPA: VWA domain-containing protein [Candidatus Bathyarchaeia archaeon]|nr:VWA domain-containing protein [Candidatus Bathyarchaeia archaeon]
MTSPQFRRIAASLLLAFLAAAPIASAQRGSNELSDYTGAVAHVQPNERLALLEHFAMDAQPGPLKVGALEFVIWHYLRQGQLAHAMSWANELSAADPDNAVAIALLTNNATPAVERGSMNAERLLHMASHGLDMLPQLQRPLGMNGADYSLLKRQAYVMLSSAAGFAELRLKDYISARLYLHNTLALQPDSARDAYNLAQADLNGPDKNTKEGYWELARAVDLSRGTPQGIAIARAARARYVKDGGSTEDWNQFLAAASPNPNGANSTMLAATAPLPPGPHPPNATPPSARIAVARPPAPAKPRSTQPPPSVWADNSASTPPIRKRRVLSTTGPMSLGILVETSLANKENRAAVVDNLTDMLRRMNDRDEAFILSYDNNLVFVQDLTNDPKQLEQAMETIKPQRGAVLDDAVAFAAGHLARIAKYPNRVLLVISDGRNIDSHSSPLETSAEINGAGVRIYCIGLDVSDAAGQYRLRELAASTGGQSEFISTPGQFRDATRYIAQNLGIDFRF